MSHEKLEHNSGSGQYLYGGRWECRNDYGNVTAVDWDVVFSPVREGGVVKEPIVYQVQMRGILLGAARIEQQDGRWGAIGIGGPYARHFESERLEDCLTATGRHLMEHATIEAH